MGALLLPATAAAVNSFQAPVNIEPPHIAGTPGIGQSLSCSQGVWQSAENYSYTWLRDGTQILTAAGNTYTVQAVDQGHGLSCRVTAFDGGGEYTVSGLATGSYKLQFEPAFCGELCVLANYFSEYYDGKATLQAADPVGATVGTVHAGVDMAMEPGGKIVGTVIAAAARQPLADIQVCAAPLPGGSATCAVTNTYGEYRVAGLPTGTYAVVFLPRPCTETAGCTQQNYLPQAYKGKSTGAEADPVGITAGMTVTAVNAELSPGGEITGRVTTTGTHAPFEGARVCATAEAPNCTTTNANGEYTIIGLATGSYEVAFSCSAPNCPLTDQHSVAVTAGATTTGINGELAPEPAPAQITGTVTDATSHNALANIQVCTSPRSSGSNECATSESNGNYALRGLEAGTYAVEFSPSSCPEPQSSQCEFQNYLPQFYNDKTGWSEVDTITLAAGQTVSGIDAQMHPGGQIAGKVVDATTHLPIAGITACVEATVYDECGITHSNGEYTIKALTGGAYKVWFLPAPCWEPGCTQANYLIQHYNDKPSAAEADPVDVTGGTTTTGINAELQPGGQISGTVTATDTGMPLGEMRVCAFPVTTGFANCATATASAVTTAASNTLAIPATTSPPPPTTQTTSPPSTTTGNPSNQVAPSVIHKRLTASQKLAKALKACRKLKSKSKRRRCEAQAKKRYTPKRKTSHRHHKKP